MKKSLLALGVLGAFAGAAVAQSNVTLYGRVDLSVARNIGSASAPSLVMQNGSGSRFGVRGTEDLGGGLKALFQIENRFFADEGIVGPIDRFWHGRSIVGLTGGFGTVHFGRDYTTAFLLSELRSDPWGWDTVAANNKITGGLISPVRQSNAITYVWSGSGLTAGAQFAMKEAGDRNGYNFAVNYAGGPIGVNVGYVKPVNTENTNWLSLGAQYNLGVAKLGVFFGNGKLADNKHRSYLVSATAPVGAGELRFSWGKLEQRTLDVTVSQQTGIGYHYNLSKRSTVYVDVVNDSKFAQFVAPGNERKTGFNVGLKHNF